MICSNNEIMKKHGNRKLNPVTLVTSITLLIICATVVRRDENLSQRLGKTEREMKYLRVLMAGMHKRVKYLEMLSSSGRTSKGN